MSSLDTVIRSIPLDQSGKPKDPNIRYADSPIAQSAAQPAPMEASLPGLTGTPADPSPHDARFDPAEFARQLPKAETVNLASMADATAGSKGVTTAPKMKPKVEYRGKNLKPVVYELDVPFTVDGVDYDTVTLTSPRGEVYDQFRDVVVSHGSETAVLWLAMSDTPPDAVAALHQFDVAELNGLILPFLPRLMRQSIEAAQQAAQQAEEKTEASSITPSQAPA